MKRRKPFAVAPPVIVGTSLTFVRLMVTVMLSSVVVFALPAASLLSRTFTVTLKLFVPSKL